MTALAIDMTDPQTLVDEMIDLLTALNAIVENACHRDLLDDVPKAAMQAVLRRAVELGYEASSLVGRAS